METSRLEVYFFDFSALIIAFSNRSIILGWIPWLQMLLESGSNDETS